MNLTCQDFKINYFGQRINGPELVVENAIAARIPSLFCKNKNTIWAGASLPIGAGKPDFIIVAFEPKVYVLADTSHTNTQVLAYLRAVHKAKAKTIALRVRKPEDMVLESLEELVEREIVTQNSGNYSMSQEWKDILPEITCIEAKISNWKRAIQQAYRNRIFAHQSFIALPTELAKKIRTNALLKESGIGLLAVSDNGDVRIKKQPRLNKPSVWYYYYQIAKLIAMQEAKNNNAL